LPRSVNIASNKVVGAKFEDTKWVIRSCKSNDRQFNGQEKKDKKTMIYKALHRKLKVEVNRGPPEGLAGPKLPNSEQSYKGKVKTHNYINRQNQSTTGKL
jgi:hypothetical protein